MRRKSKKRIWRVIFILSLVTIQAGCAKKETAQDKKYSEVRMLMGTIVQMDVCRQQANPEAVENAYKDVWQRLEEISWKMGANGEGSDVARINHSDLKEVAIDQDTYYVLKKAREYSRSTQGAFDVTVGPLLQLWRQSAQDDIVPDKDTIRHVQFAVGFNNIQFLENDRLRLLNDKTTIDLGGIAKGYAVDEAARIFRKHGITRFFIDAGGDVYVGGNNCDGKSWRIGIRDPRDQSKIIDVVNVIDKSVATSGDYEQYYLIQGQKWSHIINPISGYPQKEVISATVIAEKAMDADALATSLCVLGNRLGTEHIDSLGGPYASLIMTKNERGLIQKFESKEYKKYKYSR